MGDETKNKLEALSEELIKSKEAIRKIKEIDKQQQIDIDKAKQNGTLKIILSFFDRTKWFWLITMILIFLLTTGYGPNQIVHWVKELTGIIGIGN